MQAILPRQQTCVLCGHMIEGKGRIDRIYCSASCRTLAWRFRTGKRAGKPQAAASSELSQKRGNPLRRAWGLKGELAAARHRIADLEAERAKARQHARAAEQRMAALEAELARERAERVVEYERLQAVHVAAMEGAAARRAEPQLLISATSATPAEHEFSQLPEKAAVIQSVDAPIETSRPPASVGSHEWGASMQAETPFPPRSEAPQPEISSSPESPPRSPEPPPQSRTKPKGKTSGQNAGSDEGVLSRFGRKLAKWVAPPEKYRRRR